MRRFSRMRLPYLVALIVLVGCAHDVARPRPAACEVSAEDRVWIDASLDAWRFSALEITGAASIRPFEAVFFDDDCVLTSANAFSVETPSDLVWTATPHAGEVTLPGGQAIPAGVISFATAEDANAFFVMSTPSVWRAAGVSNEALGLETMMTGVLLHEAAHITQSRSYGARMTEIVAANNLPDDFDDDSIQRRFGEDAAFAASVERETELLFQIAGNPDERAARRLAREALDLMQARRARWFTGPDAYLAEAEDIWLTFEGSGQWVGYQWIVHPSGGGAETDVAMANFARRGRWWSQTQGIALAFAVDRLAGFDWKRHAYGDGAMTLTQMLEAALAAPD
jgi:hypothetical protein